MRFMETPLKGAYLVELEPMEDDRGLFARSFCEKEFRAQGINPRIVQCSISFNVKKGTLRGMHYQEKPQEEAKLIRSTQGALYDVILDLREDSPTFKKWFATELTASNRKMLYAPEGFAHGFQTICDNTEVFYQISQFYSPESARGVRWDDPAFGIQWPSDARIISPRDQSYPDFCL